MKKIGKHERKKRKARKTLPLRRLSKCTHLWNVGARVLPYNIYNEII